MRASFALPLTTLLLSAPALAADAPARATPPEIVLVTGDPGAPEYAATIARTAATWAAAAIAAGAKLSTSSDLKSLAALLTEAGRNDRDPLWLVLLGHGTYDGRTAKFNLRGPDLSAAALAAQLQTFTRPLVIINAASASGAFLKPLQGSGRVLITATRSGRESSATRFADTFAVALTDPQADLDGDGNTSLFEAFVTTGSRVALSFQNEGLLATEHALLDDNGDGIGTGAEFFGEPKHPQLDGTLAHQLVLLPGTAERALTPDQRQKRDELETSLKTLRQQKDELPETRYYQRLEALLLRLAVFY